MFAVIIGVKKAVKPINRDGIRDSLALMLGSEDFSRDEIRLKKAFQAIPKAGLGRGREKLRMNVIIA